MTTKQHLEDLGACYDALEWVGDRTIEQAWAECDRSDWLLWCAARQATDEDARKKVVMCACEIARTVLHLVPASEDRPLKAIETAEAWARGEPGVGLAAVEHAARADAAAANARTKAHQRQCEIIRRYFPTIPGGEV